MIRARVITCSDSVAGDAREDRSGPAVKALLESNGYEVDPIVVVSDDVVAIARAIEQGEESGARLIVTTGGTGISARDVTPEATLTVCNRVIPGFGEVMRAASLSKTPLAALSRAQAATLRTALVVNVPGSVGGAVENLSAVLHLVGHALELLEGKTTHD